MPPPARDEELVGMGKASLQLSTLPEQFEPVIYREVWPDLGSMPEDLLYQHYLSHGLIEGRRANSVATRTDFAALIGADQDALEIGPFCNPILQGPRVKYFDVLTQEELHKRAGTLGLPDANIPYINYVSPVGDLRIVDEVFDCALSSHCLEHQPDLVAHLQQVSRVLRPGGRYFLLVPDKRYCFDAFMSESTIADVLDANFAQRRTHLLKSVIEHRALTTHNDPKRHWDGDHGILDRESPDRVMAAMKEFVAAAGGYLDVHAWYFTPASAGQLLTGLKKTGYIDMDVARIYPTRFGANEFWMVLQK